jgi:hypothetical protein
MTENAPIHAENRTAAAAVIADYVGGLAVLARSHGLSTLGYLLDMAKMEAEYEKNGRAP